jgi:hypothetical protein
MGTVQNYQSKRLFIHDGQKPLDFFLCQFLCVTLILGIQNAISFFDSNQDSLSSHNVSK